MQGACDRSCGRCADGVPTAGSSPAAAAAAANATAAAPPGLSGRAGEYTKVLALSHLFYAAQRSGRLPPDNPIPWRGDSHLNDTVVGGYHDAGDHLKLQ